MEENKIVIENDTSSENDIEVVIDEIIGQSKVEVPQIDGKAIYDFEIDNMEDKPWKKPGADITDYFNYGFTEVTWKKYCENQREFVKRGIGSSRKEGSKNVDRREERFERKDEKGKYERNDERRDDKYKKKDDRYKTRYTKYESSDRRRESVDDNEDDKYKRQNDYYRNKEDFDRKRSYRKY